MKLENKVAIVFRVNGRPTTTRVAHDHVDADIRSVDVVYIRGLGESKVRRMLCPRASYSGWNCT